MSLTSEDLQALRSEFVTKDDLRTELTRFATKDDLRTELSRALARYATREELHSEIGKHRAETAQGFADLRRYMEILHEDLISRMGVMFDGLAARIDAVDRRHTDRLDGHETRIGGLDRRVTLLEGQHPKQ